jgi:hypothetical protein
MALKYAPLARPPGFHQAAVASLATAVKAPAMPCARMPIASVVCAWLRTGARSRNTTDTKDTQDAFGLHIATLI